MHLRSRLLRSVLAGVLVAASISTATPLPDEAGEPGSEAAAIAAIERLGGAVRRVRGGGPEREVEFHLRGRSSTDAGLEQVAALRNIVRLNLRATRISDEGLASLAGLRELRRLHLERTRVGDAGLRHLARLERLEYLNLYGTRVTDAGLRHLAGLHRLRRLYVWQTGVTDAGVTRLQAALPELRVVRGVDLDTLPPYVDEELDAPKPTEELEWISATSASDAPRSQSGVNTQVLFENRSQEKVRVYWVSYGGELKLYAELAPGATRQQNTYARNTWLITDAREVALGYFVVGMEVGRAVIPKRDRAG